MPIPMPKLRELKEAIRAVIVGPYTAKFPAEPTPVPDTFRGRPTRDVEKCVGCLACYHVCPSRAIDLEDDVESKVRRITTGFDRCIFCGQCEANCITQEGVKLTQEYDLASTDRSELHETTEKELVLCEACGAIIGAEDHMRWVAQRLGPLAFANPSLMLTTLQDLDLADTAAPPSAPLRRGDRIRILCPKCRQITSMLV